jgi:ubiquinone/menaquinone biosynthesis C-methylase UbiE
LSELEITLRLPRKPAPDVSAADRVRRTYDRLAAVYPLSTYLYHSRAHRVALNASGIRDGMRVLEVATGSGEMFRRLVRANPTGSTVGLDLSPNMAARTQNRIRKEFPRARAACHAVDVRHLPFQTATFDAIFCCYLFELLGNEDVGVALKELRRVLRRDGTLTTVLISERDPLFNQGYRVCGRLAPAFWGRQVERRLPPLLKSHSLDIIDDRKVRQIFYPSRVLVARR